MEHLKILLLTQARISSSRFPNKLLQEIENSSLLEIHLKRIRNSKLVSHYCLATTTEADVQLIIDIAKNSDFEIFQGSLLDVLDRFYNAALKYKPDYIVRVTSDCPLLDSELIDQVIKILIDNQADYVANLSEDFPDGQDVEAFTYSALEKAWKEAKLPSEREHVTPFIRNNSDLKGGTLFKAINHRAPSNFNHIRMTVDEPKDLAAIEHLAIKLGLNGTWLDYTNYIVKNIDEFKNQDIIRNEGYLKSLNNDKLSL